MSLILKSKTRSLCNSCFETIPARVFSEIGKVFIEKECPRHGVTKGLLENDEDFYRKFANFHPGPNPSFHSLTLPITYRCNLKCSFCYAFYPRVPDPPLSYFKEAICNFQGPCIGISGGEPTLREDLPELIRYVKKCTKLSILLTNGLRLVDEGYLRALIREGLNIVFFSFDSFQKEFYESMKGRDILAQKKKALASLRKLNIYTILSVTIYPGVNDHELGELFLFAFKNRHFIKELRVRIAVAVRRYEKMEEYFASDLLDLFSAQMNIDKESLLRYFLNSLPNFHQKNEKHTIHHVQLLMRGICVGDKFIPIINENFLIGELLYLKLAIQNKGFKSVLSELMDLVKGINRSFFSKNMFFFKVFLRKNGIWAAFLKFIVLKYIHFTSPASMPVRLISWPTRDNIDLQELDKENAYLTKDGQVLDFCHGIIADEGIR